MMTKQHLPGDLNPQAHLCKNVRSQKNVVQRELVLSEIDYAECCLDNGMAISVGKPVLCILLITLTVSASNTM
jgi:hypothetical protein